MFKHVLIIIILEVLVNIYSEVESNLYVVKTNGTKIIGRILHTVFENKPFAAFWKIPYAAPPIGQLRFKAPQRLPWFGKQLYNYSTYFNETCSSYFNEDCLYLSIYMPLSQGISNFSIIVWIHEDSHTHGPDFLIDENVIIITVSFRTSILGFLNTGDSFAEGNMGAKDIIAALRWIRNYISYFNGDINRVTVFGSETTASIVASLPLSSTNEHNIFNRVIVQGGSALSPAIYREINFEIMKKLYWKLNGPFQKFNRTKLYELISTSTKKELLSASEDLFDSTEIRDHQRLINSFGPTVEVTGKETFMNKFPLEVYKREITNNAVQVMMGYTNLDSVYKLEGFVRNRQLLKYLNYNFQYLLPFEGRADEYGSKVYRKVRRKIMDFYFVNGTVGENSLKRYAKYVSDQVIYPVLRQARLHAQVSRNHVYLYRFTFKGSFNIIWNTLLSNLELSGAAAGDQICYQFKCKSLSDDYSTEGSNERFFIRKIARLLANFAKHGNPTPDKHDEIIGDLQWPPLAPHKSMKGLNMGKALKIIKMPEEKRMEFWDQLKKDFFSDNNVRDEL